LPDLEEEEERPELERFLVPATIATSSSSAPALAPDLVPLHPPAVLDPNARPLPKFGEEGVEAKQAESADGPSRGALGGGRSERASKKEGEEGQVDEEEDEEEDDDKQWPRCSGAVLAAARVVEELRSLVGRTIGFVFTVLLVTGVIVPIIAGNPLYTAPMFTHASLRLSLSVAAAWATILVLGWCGWLFEVLCASVNVHPTGPWMLAGGFILSCFRGWPLDTLITVAFMALLSAISGSAASTGGLLARLGPLTTLPAEANATLWKAMYSIVAISSLWGL
jgi:hypothetical protein